MGIRSLVEGAVLVGALVAALSACDRRPTADATTIVVAHHAGELAPALSVRERERLHALAADPRTDGAVVHVVAAGRAAVETVDIEPRRPNGTIERADRIDALVDERLAEVDRAIRRAAEQGRDVDLLRALGVAAQTGAPWIILLSSGLSTTDPLDMRVAGWDQDPHALARDLAGRHLLPPLAGRRLELSGLARTAGAQPALGLREQARLRDEWTAVGEAAGASVSVDDAVRPAGPPVSTLTPPVVEVPAVTTTPGPSGTETVAVPSALLFGPDSCAVLDESAARAVLAPVRDRLLTGGWIVAISGRTAPVGDTGIPLATCRAQKAAALLDVPPSAIAGVRGDGSLLDPPGAALDAAGHPDPARLAALRRVVFTLIPTKESR